MIFQAVFIVSFLSSFFLTNSFITRQSRVSLQTTRWTNKQLSAVNKDLFSDDLFDDNDEPSDKKKSKLPKEPTLQSSRKYLDQDWKLNEEDSKGEYKGTTAKKERIFGQAPTDKEKLPVFALMYKFRKEYANVGAESLMADHKGYCGKWTRLANSQYLNTAKGKGVVVLWLGQSEKDKESTRAEIMSFLEEDPLIEKDVVESWDLIDLTEKGVSADLPAAIAGK